MRSWPHAPYHCFNEKGSYMVTGATLHKELIFRDHEELELLHNLLLSLAKQYEWHLEAWAVFSNHYHFLGHSLKDPLSLGKFIRHLHATSAREINEKQKRQGRKVWFQYWDSKITFQKSYLARLNYIMQNPVKHKIVSCASEYPWCSAKWFELSSSKAQFQTVTTLNTDSVNVIDDFLTH